MGRKIGEAFVTVTAKLDDKFDTPIKARMPKAGAEAGTRFGGAFKLALAPIIGGIGALFAGRAVIDFFKGTIDEANEATRATAQTNAVLRSTKGAAHVSAQAIGDLATAISNKIGVDDEAIQSSENLLLTFTRVRNGVGKNNDIFSQATSVIADMTAAMHNGQVTTDGLKTSTIQVGKALNDPLKGITALTKVGVTFNDQQKKQIAAMVKAGNIAGAQKVILAELTKEFGGSAAAAALPADKMRVAWGNLQETIGGLVMPVLGRLANAASGLIAKVSAFAASPAVAAFGRTLSTGISTAYTAARRFVTGFDWSPAIRVAKALWTVITVDIVPALVGLYRTYGPAVGTALGAVFKAVGILAPVLTGLGTALKATFGFIADNKATVATFAGIILAVVAAIKIWRAVTLVMTAVQTALDVALDANPIGLIVVAIAALVAAIVWVATKTRFFQTVWQAVWGFLKGVGAWFAGPFANFFIAGYNIVVNDVLHPIKKAAEDVGKFFTKTLPGWFSSAWDAITGAFSAAKKFIIEHVIAPLVGGILGFLSSIANGAATAFGWIPGLGGKLKDAATNFAAFKDRVNASLRGITDQDVVVHVRADYGSIAPGARNRIRAGLNAGIRFRAAGGSIPPFGWSWVGEDGAELIRAGSSGAVVASHGRSVAMAGDGGGGGGVHFHFHNSVVASRQQAEDLIYEAYNNLVRKRRIRVAT